MSEAFPSAFTSSIQADDPRLLTDNLLAGVNVSTTHGSEITTLWSTQGSSSPSQCSLSGYRKDPTPAPEHIYND